MIAGELPAQEPDEKPGPGAGVVLMVWKDVDALCASEGAPAGGGPFSTGLRCASVEGHRPSPSLRLVLRKNDSPRSRSGFFNRLAEGDLIGALHDGDAVGNERVAQDVPRPRDAEGFREGGDFAVLS